MAACQAKNTTSYTAMAPTTSSASLIRDGADSGSSRRGKKKSNVCRAVAWRGVRDGARIGERMHGGRGWGIAGVG